jgi:hypothetical protein
MEGLPIVERSLSTVGAGLLTATSVSYSATRPRLLSVLRRSDSPSDYPSVDTGAHPSACDHAAPQDCHTPPTRQYHNLTIGTSGWYGHYPRGVSEHTEEILDMVPSTPPIP